MCRGGAHLGRRHRVHEIADRLRLHQIELAVDERAQRELTGPGRPRAERDGPVDDGRQNHRAAVRRHLEHVFARIRGGTRKESHERVGAKVVSRDGGANRAAWGPWPGAPGESVADRGGRRSTEAHHADAAVPGRCRHGHDGVVCGEHGRPRASAGTSRSRTYLLTEMMTVFSNESPMLSVPTDGMSATAMCTIRRS